MLKTSFVACLGLCPAISTQFTLEMCVRRQIAKKITKNPYFYVQGCSKSSMLVHPETSSTVLVMMRSKSVPISATVLLLEWTTVETAR